MTQGIELGDLAGLPLRLDPHSFTLDFGPGLEPVRPQARTLEEMRPVLYNQTATAPAELYWMYRDVARPRDKDRLAGHSLRFDVTVLAPGLVGGEYVKTAGHYHAPLDPGAAGEAAGPEAEASGVDALLEPRGRTYPELYQVLHGLAHYLLQRPAASGPPGTLDDVVVVEAGPGDSLYVPPGYGHVTINRGPGPLVMANVVEATFVSVYEPYRRRRGAAYYEVEEDSRGFFVPNGHYPSPPEPRLGRTTRLGDLGLEEGVPLYVQLTRDPSAFRFLVRPETDGPSP
ncbi:MAG: glucose-6-phosphate isomerase [Firmicutes bacterium]|nr:glucose-6-phosphate isomerase [Bacillota bacterium]